MLPSLILSHSADQLCTRNNFFIPHTVCTKTSSSETQLFEKLRAHPLLLTFCSSGDGVIARAKEGHTDEEEDRSLWGRHYLHTSPQWLLMQCAHRVPDQISSCATSEET